MRNCGSGSRGVPLSLPFFPTPEDEKIRFWLFLSDVGFVCGSLSSIPTYNPPFINPFSYTLGFHSSYELFSGSQKQKKEKKKIKMLDPENGRTGDSLWAELKLPDIMFTNTVRELHAGIENKWDSLQLSACQTAAGRALWKHVIHDPLAELLGGETYLKSLHEKIKKDQLNNAREVSGVILAVRTLWFDKKLEAALTSFNGGENQVVLLGAGMDARAYRLSCLKESHVFEVDLPEVLQMKSSLLQVALQSTNEDRLIVTKAKSLNSVAADIRDNDWLEKLQKSGYVPEKNTVWVLEGILYYLSHPHAIQVLKIIADNCAITQTVLLADFMNKPSTMLSKSVFHFYSDWPDHLLPSLGFSDVKLSQIGDPDAHFGLMHDPLNLFNKLRNLPRSVQTHPDDGTPCCRLYLVQASGSLNQCELDNGK